MWIDRVVTELESGPQILDLHPLLTVLSSNDRAKRRAPFERVYQALRGERGAHLEVRTENRDPVVALRPQDGEFQLIDPELEEELDQSALARSGIVGQLNSAAPMAGHLRLLYVTAENMRERSETDDALIQLAQTPLDQLWKIATEIQANREVVEHTEAQGSNLHEAVRQRESIEESYSEILEEKQEHARRNQLIYLGSGISLAVAAMVAASYNPLYVIPPLAVGLVLAAAGFLLVRNRRLDEEHDEITKDYGGSGFSVQLGRLDELFNTNSIYRRQREARDNLQRSLEMWHELAGPADPSVLIRERPRLEELAGHIRLVNNEEVHEAGVDDQRILYGLASLLAELTRRFPSERVPLLVEDLFADVHPEYHAALRELLLRASHRRQVILETADLDVANWAAAEVVAGDAMLITDQPIDVANFGSAHDQAFDEAV